LRGDFTKRVPELEAGLRAERDRLEVSSHRRPLELIEVLPGCGEKLSGLVQSDPAFDSDATHVPVGGLEVKILPRVASLNHGPRVSGRTGLMHDDRGSRSFLRSDFVFVGPTTVVRHRGPLEHLVIKLQRVAWVRYGRIVDQNDNRFAAHIEAFEIVPAVFRGDNSIADEHQLRLTQVDLGDKSLRPYD